MNRNGTLSTLMAIPKFAAKAALALLAALGVSATAQAVAMEFSASASTVLTIDSIVNTSGGDLSALDIFASADVFDQQALGNSSTEGTDAALDDDGDDSLDNGDSLMLDAMVTGLFTDGNPAADAFAFTDAFVSFYNASPDEVFEINFTLDYSLLTSLSSDSGDGFGSANAIVQLFSAEFEGGLLDQELILVEEVLTAELGFDESLSLMDMASFSFILSPDETLELTLFTDADGFAINVPIGSSIGLMALGLAFALRRR